MSCFVLEEAGSGKGPNAAGKGTACGLLLRGGAAAGGRDEVSGPAWMQRVAGHLSCKPALCFSRNVKSWLNTQPGKHDSTAQRPPCVQPVGPAWIPDFVWSPS